MSANSVKKTGLVNKMKKKRAEKKMYNCIIDLLRELQSPQTTKERRYQIEKMLKDDYVQSNPDELMYTLACIMKPNVESVEIQTLACIKFEQLFKQELMLKTGYSKETQVWRLLKPETRDAIMVQCLNNVVGEVANKNLCSRKAEIVGQINNFCRKENTVWNDFNHLVDAQFMNMGGNSSTILYGVFNPRRIRVAVCTLQVYEKLLARVLQETDIKTFVKGATIVLEIVKNISKKREAVQFVKYLQTNFQYLWSRIIEMSDRPEFAYEGEGVLNMVIYLIEKYPSTFNLCFDIVLVGIIKAIPVQETESSALHCFVEMMQALVTEREERYSASPYIAQSIHVLMELMLRAPDEQEWNSNTSQQMDDDNTDYAAAEYALDKIANEANTEIVGPIIYDIMMQYITVRNRDWKCIRAGLIGFTCVIEGLNSAIAPRVTDIMNAVVNISDHEHPQVRHAVAQVFGQFSYDYVPTFQQNHYNEFFNVIIRYASDPHSRVRINSMLSIYNFCHGAPLNTIYQFKDQIIQLFLYTLNSDSLDEKTSISLPMEEVFSILGPLLGPSCQYILTSICQQLQYVGNSQITNPETAEVLSSLRTKLLEILSSTIYAVGPLARPHLQQVVDLLHALYNSNTIPKEDMAYIELFYCWEAVSYADPALFLNNINEILSILTSSALELKKYHDQDFNNNTIRRFDSESNAIEILGKVAVNLKNIYPDYQYNVLTNVLLPILSPNLGVTSNAYLLVSIVKHLEVVVMKNPSEVEAIYQNRVIPAMCQLLTVMPSNLEPQDYSLDGNFLMEAIHKLLKNIAPYVLNNSPFATLLIDNIKIVLKSHYMSIISLSSDTCPSLYDENIDDENYDDEVEEQEIDFIEKAFLCIADLIRIYKADVVNVLTTNGYSEFINTIHTKSTTLNEALVIAIMEFDIELIKSNDPCILPLMATVIDFVNNSIHSDDSEIVGYGARLAGAIVQSGFSHFYPAIEMAFNTAVDILKKKNQNQLALNMHPCVESLLAFVANALLGGKLNINAPEAIFQWVNALPVSVEREELIPVSNLHIGLLKCRHDTVVNNVVGLKQSAKALASLYLITRVPSTPKKDVDFELEALFNSFKTEMFAYINNEMFAHAYGSLAPVDQCVIQEIFSANTAAPNNA